MSDSDGEKTAEEAVEGATAGGDGVEVAGSESDGHDPATAGELSAIRSALTDLRETTDRLEDSVDADVEDLRERFVRLYRDLEAKADADHEHPETADRMEAVASDVATAVERLDGVESRIGSVEDVLDRLDSTLDAVETDVDAVDERVANAEERLSTAEGRLEELTTADEDRSEKLSRVARAVVGAQRELRVVRRDRADRERLDSILRRANRHGVTKADCEGCGNTVQLSLLSSPECPYCEARFDEIDPADRFYRRSTLSVDETPALEGDVASSGPVSASTDSRDGTPSGSDPADGEGVRRDDEASGASDRGNDE